jgi:hypothetical protein
MLVEEIEERGLRGRVCEERLSEAVARSPTRSNSISPVDRSLTSGYRPLTGKPEIAGATSVRGLIGGKEAKSVSPAEKTRLARLGSSDTAHQTRKTGITAERIKEGMYFDVLQDH